MARRPASIQEAAVSVTVANRQRLVHVATAWFEQIVRRGLAAEGVGRAEISVLIVNDRRIGRLHAEWFADPSPTDVITFPLSEPGAAVLAGDIVVSAETARRRGREFGWTPREELAYYVVHGLLHLTGHDDNSRSARRAMRARERAVLRTVGLAAPPRRATRRPA